MAELRLFCSHWSAIPRSKLHCTTRTSQIFNIRFRRYYRHTLDNKTQKWLQNMYRRSYKTNVWAELPSYERERAEGESICAAELSRCIACAQKVFYDGGGGGGGMPQPYASTGCGGGDSGLALRLPFLLFVSGAGRGSQACHSCVIISGFDGAT